ncbi:unnamed protein product [Pleuronectes platessa]|uniref:Immunoglobulin V-set domain-containing protein n=1 Tax=Pleuronectes platessa TaxID=8262 RepID=A0A9N7YVS3_PLEPL|nr:unnamed protein product [Pleuronectes platessa]
MCEQDGPAPEGAVTLSIKLLCARDVLFPAEKTHKIRCCFIPYREDTQNKDRLAPEGVVTRRMKLPCARDVLFPAEKTHKIRGRMIPWILMLFILTPCVCAGTLVVNVKQPSYQAETVNRRDSKILYHLHKGIEVQRSQDQQFSGRVQCDEGVLKEGRLRLHVSRIRSEDSGQYVCEVNRDHDGNYGKCQLVVIKPADQPKTRETRRDFTTRGRDGTVLPSVSGCSWSGSRSHSSWDYSSSTGQMPLCF